MIAYLVRRLLIGMVTLLLVTFLVYGLIRSMPGDPLLARLERSDPSRKLRAEDLERMQKAYNLDKPWPQGYLIWLSRVARLDFDVSISRGLPVAQVIGERVWPTLMLSLSSFALAYLLAIPLGLYSTSRSGRLDERIVSVLLYMLYSLPIFVAALFLQVLLFVRLGWLPLDGMYDPQHEEFSTLGKVWDVFKHALLPIVCETYAALAYYSRFIRSNLHEVLRQDYIRTARAKGVSPRRVLVRHAFRNTLIPLVTMIGLSLPALLSGAVIIEQIFTWPGIGKLFFESVLERDYPTIMGLVLLFSTLTLAGQLLADVLYAVVDPRVTYS
jgi:peptide/nickel transport system permease protein